VRHYTHASALADLEEIRQRLGFASINLWGGSWGTRAALFYALRYPDVVRSVVLDGAAPLDLGFPRTVAQDAERALNLLVERCAAEAACRTAFPHARPAIDALLERLSVAPPTMSLKHPRTAVPVSLTLTRDTVAEIIRVALYTTTDAARLLPTIQHATAGDFAPLIAQYVHSTTMTTDEMALGATMSVLCSEDMPLVADTDFKSEAQGTFVGTSYADAWRSRCVGWPVGPELTMDHGGTSGAAALILSGETDPITPPQRGDAMARHFPRRLHLVVPGAAHNASFTGCVPDLIAAFLDRGDATPLDTSCIAKVSLPSIVLDDAGGRP
jgi:pimeloyl-ACP methyl ester carboxylesterase